MRWLKNDELAQKQQILSTQEVTGSVLAYRTTFPQPTNQNPTRISCILAIHCPFFNAAHFQESKESRKVRIFQINESHLFSLNTLTM